MDDFDFSHLVKPQDDFDFAHLIKKDEPSVLEDVAKSAASGVGRGAAGLPGIFGDIHEIAKAAPFAPKRSMYDALSEMLGAKFPTSQDTIGAATAAVPGLGYKPETGAGEYAQRAGEFVPAAVAGGGGMARNALRYGVIPGVASKGAEDLAAGSGHETAASVGGALAGAMAGPRILNAPGRVLSPIAQRPEIASAVKTMEQEGVPLTAGQRTGNKAIQWMEAAAADMPFAAKSAADLHAEQASALNKAFAKRMGHSISEPTGQMTEDEWKAAKDALGQRYDQLNSRTRMKFDPQLGADVTRAKGDYEAMTSETARAPIVGKWASDISEIPNSHGGALPGDVYQSWRSDLAEAARRAGPGSKEEFALNDMKRALDDAINRSTSPHLAPIRAELNRDYANFKALEKSAGSAGENAARDFISPALVRREAAKRKSAYLQGKSDLGNVAKSAEAVVKPLPSSGTAQRTMAMNLFHPATAAAGFAAGGLPGMIGGWLAPSVVARGLMSRPAQAWLGGKLAVPGLIDVPTKARKIKGILGAGAVGSESW